MKQFFIFIFVFSLITLYSQETETIKIPVGVVYNYCENSIVENAKKQLKECLTQNDNCSILQDKLTVGPVLWNRFNKIKKIAEIKDTNVIFYVDGNELSGKMTQKLKDTKIIWEEIKNEVLDDFIIRKANENELNYYWSIISFDIEEPLLILETKNHIYILNFIKDNLKLIWIEEYPYPRDYQVLNKNSQVNVSESANTNNSETDITNKKETKLEKIVFLNTDDELKKNITVEEIQSIISKTNKIFEELFSNSDKLGKILVQFTLKKKENTIQFSIRDNLDSEIMKQFEERVNNENFPNSKKEEISFNLIFKVNSYND
jgi:hypothetical protein